MSNFINIGTIGHVDDGKTTLSAALSKICAEEDIAGGSEVLTYSQIDSAPEEKARGITINRRHLLIKSKKRQYGLIDCPGHKDYIKNMIAGAAQLQIAILVVSATNGVMPQTKEHILLASCIGIKHVVVFLNKVDLTDEETIEFAEMDVRELLSKHKYDGDNISVIRGSALCALEGKKEEIGRQAIIKLLETVDSIEVADLPSDQPFLMPIEGVHSIPGRGTVATGCVERGILKANEEVEIIGLTASRKTICTGIEAFHKSLPQANPGESIGLLLRGIKREEIERGQVLAKPGSIKSHTKFVAEVYVIKKEDGGRHTPFFTNYRPQFFLRTADVTGVVTLPDDVEMVMPGDNLKVTVTLIQQVAMHKGLRFAFREGGKTIGHGVILEIIE